MQQLNYKENKDTNKDNSIVKIAMIGDQGTTKNSKRLLKVIKDQGVELLLINGDFDYENDPKKWQEMNEDILGKDFPIIAVYGNHDLPYYGEYKKVIEKWLNNPKLDCIGDAGIRTTCTYKGIQIVSSSAGLLPEESDRLGERDVKFIHDSFNDSNSKIRICQWHKNMRDMQTGDKGDETGWGVYEECRKQGALITTGHEHSYSRTYLLNDIPNKEIVSTSDEMSIKKGQTIVVVSGLGGMSSREDKSDGYWWASKENRDTGVDAGALICSYDLNTNLATCYFIDINYNTKDIFYLKNNL